MKYCCSKKKIIISCLLITLLLFGSIWNSNIFSIVVEKFYRHNKPSNISLLNLEDGVLLTAQLGVNFSFFNTTENDWIREIDKATTLIHKKLSIQHRRHGLPFLVRVPVQRQQSVCVVSIHEYSVDQMQSLVEKLMAHKQTFAQHHNVSNMGYINVNAQKYRDDNRHLYLANVSSTWLKLPILRDMILSGQNQQQQRISRYDWFMWVDADVLFTNFSCTFQELLSANHHLIVPGDFNTGVFFIRNHPWSAKFLDLWFSKWSAFRSRLGQEDEALGSLLIDDSWNRYIYAIPMEQFKWIVSYPGSIHRQLQKPSIWQPGHCVLHVAGFWQQKASILRACLQSERACVERLDQIHVECDRDKTNGTTGTLY